MVEKQVTDPQIHIPVLNPTRCERHEQQIGELHDWMVESRAPIRKIKLISKDVAELKISDALQGQTLSQINSTLKWLLGVVTAIGVGIALAYGKSKF